MHVFVQSCVNYSDQPYMCVCFQSHEPCIWSSPIFVQMYGSTTLSNHAISDLVLVFMFNQD